MTAADLLRRAEEPARWSRLTWSILGVVVAVLLIGGGVRAIYHRGIDQGRALEQSAQVRQALQHNAEALRITRARADSEKAADHATSLRAAAARTAATAHRPIVDQLAAQLHVSGQVGDSLVVLERPAAGANDGARIDSLAALPLPVASFIREAELQLGLDVAALHADTLAMAVKDRRIATLERADSLSQARDSLHVVREGQLEHDARTAGQRGFWRGVKAGVVGTVVALGAAAVLRR